MNSLNTQDAIRSYFHRKGGKYGFCNKLNTFYRNAITKYLTLLKVLFPNNAYKEIIENTHTTQQTIAINTTNNKPNETATSTKRRDIHQSNNNDKMIINVSLMNVQNEHMS
jgi:hypothetical protein